jgi:hypothetical protein
VGAEADGLGAGVVGVGRVLRGAADVGAALRRWAVPLLVVLALALLAWALVASEGDGFRVRIPDKVRAMR